MYSRCKIVSIFIFEDNILQAQNMKKIIEEICLKHQIPYDFIETTSRSEQLLNKIPLTTQIPIYFLDIEIKNENLPYSAQEHFAE